MTATNHTSALGPSNSVNRIANGTCTNAITHGRRASRSGVPRAPNRYVPLARIESVRLEVHDVVPAVEQHTEREAHVKETEPELSVREDVSPTNGHEIKPDRREPKAWARRLDDECDLRREPTRATRSGDGHLRHVLVRITDSPPPGG